MKFSTGKIVVFLALLTGVTLLPACRNKKSAAGAARQHLGLAVAHFEIVRAVAGFVADEVVQVLRRFAQCFHRVQSGLP